MSTDKEIYQSIAEEIAANKTDAALWTQATVLAEGDPGRTQATYIRLRFSELKKTTAASVQPEAASNSVAARDAALQRMRTDLARKLQLQGKSSLYTTLGLQPDASDAVVAAAIADRDAGDFAGHPSDQAEFRYAKRILGDPEARKEYDRKLLQEMLSSESIRMSVHTPVASHSSWWSARMTAVVIGLLAIAIFGFWSNDFFRATKGHEVQKAEVDVRRDAVDVQRDALQSAAEAERIRLQAENEMRQRSMAMNEEAQWRAMNNQAQSQERMRIEQERRETLERERKAQQQQMADNQRAQREKQYWTCINQQLDMRGVTTSDAYSRCAMYNR